MQRIEMRHLEASVKTLNEMAGASLTAWADGKGQIGNYHVYGDQCGYCLHMTMNEGGGVHTIIGYSTKRELNNCVRAMIAGIILGKNLKRTA